MDVTTRLPEDGKPVVILIYSKYDPTPVQVIGPFENSDDAGFCLGHYADFFSVSIDDCKIVEIEHPFLDKNGMLPIVL